MTIARPPRIHLIAVIVAIFAALIGRAWLEVKFLADGLEKDYAADLSYLVVPPILLVLLFPVVRYHRSFIASLFELRGLSLRIALNALAIGVLLRLTAWSELFAGISFGFYKNADASAVIGPAFSFNCPEPHVIALGFAVMVLMVPFIEELIHRGLIQSWLSHLGPVVAILSSSILFMLSHRPSTWGYVFYAGLVFGILFWQNKTVWPSLITHATVNGLIQIDWRCLQGKWNPPASQLPIWSAGLLSLLMLLACTFAIAYLLLKKKAGAQEAPRR